MDVMDVMDVVDVMDVMDMMGGGDPILSREFCSRRKRAGN